MRFEISMARSCWSTARVAARAPSCCTRWSKSRANAAMPKIAFLGAGNMASAMVDGLLAQSTVAKSDLICLGGSGQTASQLAARSGIRLAKSLAELTQESDVVVIAFKPQQLSAADPRLAQLTAGKLVISILAGK